MQTLSLFAYIRQHAKGPRSTLSLALCIDILPGTIEPHLVVCPLSVLASWEAECARWFPSARAVRLQGAASERARFKNTPGALDGVDILLTTYETFVAEASWFKSRRWVLSQLS
jgi:SWI/SNF-related matrix-associated actin-dependent regulator of chromatin subfamily A member 5